MMQTFDETAVDALVWYRPERMKGQFDMRLLMNKVYD